MSLRQMVEHAGEWLRGAGPHSEIVISSRIRLARNLAGFPFVNRCTNRQRAEVIERCKAVVTGGALGERVLWVDLTQASDLDRQLLVERHLISRQHAAGAVGSHGPNQAAAQAAQASASAVVGGGAAPAGAGTASSAGGLAMPRAVALDADETFSIMINEEDHLRIQAFRSGMQLTEAYEQVSRVDDALESKLDFAYSPQFGYLSACPTNVGTGIRVSVMLHLPALQLTGEIEKVRRAARDMHLAVRGLFGEGSEALGDLYQVSNQTTLGRSEQEFLADFEHTIVPQIISYEQQARQALVNRRADQLDDKIYRAWGLLTHARMMGTEEVLQLLSHLRLGVNLGRIDTVDIRSINELFLLTQPAHLQKLSGQEMDQTTRREARARLIRRKLGAR